MNTYLNKLFIIPNLSDQKYYYGVTNAIDTLMNNGFSVSIKETDSIILYGTTNHSLFKETDADYVVTLGGDGSFLIGSQKALVANKPIFGINYGHRGYLCLFNKDEISSITPELLSTKRIENNTVLEIEYDNKLYYSINEVMCAKDNFGGSIQLNLSVNNEKNEFMRGDGVIISTPIGSTSYNATCGGHILKRDSNEFAITPILKNSGSLTSLTYQDHKNVFIENANQKYKINIYSDGKLVGELKETLKIYKSEKILSILK